MADGYGFSETRRNVTFGPVRFSRIRFELRSVRTVSNTYSDGKNTDRRSIRHIKRQISIRYSIHIQSEATFFLKNFFSSHHHIRHRRQNTLLANRKTHTQTLPVNLVRTNR